MSFQEQKRLNVLACAYGLAKNDVGESRMAFEWINRLSEFVNFQVITTGSRLHSVCGLEDNKHVKLIILKPHISFKRWDTFDRIVHPGYIEFFLRAYIVARKLASQLSFDLCHHFTPRSLRYPSPLLNTGFPFIIGPIHGGLKPPSVMRELEGKEEGFLKLRLFDELRLRYDMLLRRHYDKTKRIIVSAPYVQDILPLQYRGKCMVISPPPPYDIEIRSHKAGKPGGRVNILQMIYVGRLVPSKGLELLLLAMAKCQSRNIKLIIFGRGSQEECYRKMVQRLGINDKVVWKGFVPHEKVVKAYIDADIFAFPSVKEPTGIALTEAMASGLPILCVDSGGPAYIVTDGCGVKVALSTKDKMVADFAKAIDVLTNDPALREGMGKKARNRIRQEFTWDFAIDKMRKLYDEIGIEKQQQE